MRWLFIMTLTALAIQLQAREYVTLTTRLPSLKDTSRKASPERRQAPTPLETAESGSVVAPVNNNTEEEYRQDASTHDKTSMYYSPDVNERTEPPSPPNSKEDARDIQMGHTSISESIPKKTLYTAIIHTLSDKDKEVPQPHKDKARYSWLSRNNSWPWHRLVNTVINPSMADLTIEKAYSFQWVRTRDDKGNVIFQWYDHDGRLLYSLDADTYHRRKSMCFQLLLELLTPHIFEPSFPPLGGWHRWEYKMRQVPGRSQRDERKKNNPSACPSAPAGNNQESTNNNTAAKHASPGVQGSKQLSSPVNKCGSTGNRTLIDMDNIKAAIRMWKGHGSKTGLFTEQSTSRSLPKNGINLSCTEEFSGGLLEPLIAQHFKPVRMRSLC